MSLVSNALFALTIGMTAPVPLRVCADPNNLPFSNRAQQGFENQIAALVARELQRPLEYVWSPQRRGFVRTTLNAGRCDVIIGVPKESSSLLATRPYYRSTYAFVTKASRRLALQSLDDPRLRTLTIGIQVTGEDYQNPPAAQALARRGIISNVRGFPVYGDYSQPDPQRPVVDAVASGTIDVAIVWGPLAGYYASRAATALDVKPIADPGDGPALVFAFDIAMGVRRTDTKLRDALEAVVEKDHTEIQRILTRYGVPLR